MSDRKQEINLQAARLTVKPHFPVQPLPSGPTKTPRRVYSTSPYTTHQRFRAMTSWRVVLAVVTTTFSAEKASVSSVGGPYRA